MLKRLFLLIIFIVLVNYLYADNWHILNEGSHGNINSIDFVNQTTGWAAGFNGLLLKTEDGGETWTNLVYKEGAQIYIIDFVNEMTGYAYGWDPDNGENVIIKTIDGGKNWTVKYDITDYSVDAIQVLNESIVFAIGYNGLILRTTDGGDNWHNISPLDENNNFRSIRFINEFNGVVIGSHYDIDTEKTTGIILKTDNGGEKWNYTIVKNFQDMAELQFVNDSTGFFLAWDDSGQCKFCQTKDTLNSWSIKSVDSRYINRYWAISEDSIFSILTDYQIMIGVSGLYLSTDSGVSWNKIKSLGNWTVSEFMFFKNLGFLAGTLGFGMWGEMGTLLLRSANTGLNWDISILSYPFTEVHFINNQEGFAGGGSSDFHSMSGDLFKTNDGGVTWEINLTPGSMVKSCQFVDFKTGYVLSEGMWAGSHIYKTTNAGTDWKIIFDENSIRGDNFFTGTDMVFVDENTAYAVGYYWDGTFNNAAILATVNGGNDWEIIWQYPSTEAKMYRLNSIHFLNKDIGYAVGTNGMIVKFNTDSGWQLQKWQTDKQLDKVFFFDQQHGWASGGYYYTGVNELIFMKTTDGGKNWSIYPDLLYDIEDIYFFDANNGWAVGSDTSYHGLILSTQDGGEHWNKMAENLPAPLRSLYIKDGLGWAVGEMGLVLKYDGTTWIDQYGNDVSITDFHLFQNYPNPFNPKTVIRYSVGAIHESPLHIDLSIYNILGQKVVTLVNNKQQTGSYKVEWDASSFASGIYMYQLKVGDHIETKKMILMK
jgi:photosystem II stability/assembly factor-like uncharacterized protein